MRALKGGNHPTEETLLAYVDGELSPSETRAVRSHLSACWQCRNQLRDIEKSISGYMHLREDWAGRNAENPRISPASFEARIEEFERQAPPPRPWASWRSMANPLMWWRPVWRITAVVILVACLGAWYSFRKPKVVSAAELLNRAENQVASRMDTIEEPVLYQKSRFERSVAGEIADSTNLRYWTDRDAQVVHPAGGGEAWDMVTAVFRSNSLDGATPLSVNSYRRWRDNTPRLRERVTEKQWPDGRTVLSLEGEKRGGGREDEILAQELVVRARDWHPVRQTYRVLQKPYEVELQFTEIAYDVVSRDSLPDEVKAGFNPPELPREETRQPDAAVSSITARTQTPNRLAVAEVRVRYRLHQSGACHKDLVGVFPLEAGGVEVRGLVDTGARRAELQNALENLQLGNALQLDIRSVEEATRAGDLFEVLEGIEIAGPNDLTHRAAGSRTLPSDALVREFFVEHRPLDLSADDGGRKAIIQFADQALSLARSAVVESAALQRLARRYRDGAFDGLDLRSRRMLDEMLRNHLSALEENLRSADDLLAPLAETTLGRAAARRLKIEKGRPDLATWVDAVDEACELTREMHQSLTLLFTGETDTETSILRDVVSSLTAAIAHAQDSLSSIERGLAARTTASAQVE